MNLDIRGKLQQFSQRIINVSPSTKLTLQTVFRRGTWALIPITSISTLIYGFLYIIPCVVTGTSPLVHLIALLVPCWCLFGILANLFLLHVRDTSIRGRLCKILPEGNNAQDSDGGTCIVENHIVIDAIDRKPGWHFCISCQIYVPPRTWHCQLCKTCILRRDHHCAFSMCCIGEDNHINFLGFLFYLVLGTTYSTVVGMIYVSLVLGMSPYWHVLKSVCTLYIMLFDFSTLNILSSIVFLGGINSLTVFSYYVMLAFKNETISDKKREVKFSVTERHYSYANLRAFLGPYPLLRLIWPFSPVLKKEYGSCLRAKGEVEVDIY